MAINKVLLAKQINGEIEYLYPKTTADQVLYNDTLTVKNLIDNLNRETFDLYEKKINKPIDEDSGYPTDGYSGQILQSNGDGTTSWIDYIANGLSAIRIVGTNSGGEWGYINYNDIYQGQIVQVSNYNITPNSQITIQFTEEQAEVFQEKNLSFLPETRTVSIQGPNGEITYKTFVIIFAVGDIPENDYTMQVTVTEVA